jgi:KEOPS complex subunit Cgi121
MEVVDGRVTVADVDAFLADLAAVAEAHDVTVQAFDARYVVDRTHLERAVTLADRAFDNDTNVARNRAVEILLFAAGRRQIERAMAMGVEAGENRVVVVVDGPGDESAAAAALREQIEPEETLGDFDRDRVMDFFDITEQELAATDAGLPALVHERVALLVVER